MAGFVTVLAIIAVILLNSLVVYALLSCKTWQRVILLIALAILAPVAAVLVGTIFYGEMPDRIPKIVWLSIFSIMGPIILLFMQTVLHTRMRKRKAEVFGYEIAPSQGFVKDFLLQIPKMQPMALVILLLVTLFEIVLIAAPDDMMPVITP